MPWGVPVSRTFSRIWLLDMLNQQNSQEQLATVSSSSVGHSRWETHPTFLVHTWHIYGTQEDLCTSWWFSVYCYVTNLVNEGEEGVEKEYTSAYIWESCKTVLNVEYISSLRWRVLTKTARGSNPTEALETSQNKKVELI